MQSPQITRIVPVPQVSMSGSSSRSPDASAPFSGLPGPNFPREVPHPLEFKPNVSGDGQVRVPVPMPFIPVSPVPILSRTSSGAPNASGPSSLLPGSLFSHQVLQPSAFQPYQRQNGQVPMQPAPMPSGQTGQPVLPPGVPQGPTVSPGLPTHIVRNPGTSSTATVPPRASRKRRGNTVGPLEMKTRSRSDLPVTPPVVDVFIVPTREMILEAIRNLGIDHTKPYQIVTWIKDNKGRLRNHRDVNKLILEAKKDGVIVNRGNSSAARYEIVD